MGKLTSSKKLCFLCFIPILLSLFFVSATNFQPEFTSHLCSNITHYNKNLHTLLTSLPSNIKTNKWFYSLTAGQSPDQVNVLALCQGDLSVESCRTCVDAAAQQIVRDCPNQKEAIGWYDNCMIRYSNNSIPGAGDRDLLPSIINGAVAADTEGFSSALRALLERLKTEAAAGDSTLKFAVGEMAAPNLDTIYGLVQCIPVLSYMDCYNCLAQAASDLHTPSGNVGARVFVTSCNLRYETYLFYDPPPPLPPPTLSSLSPSTTPGRIILHTSTGIKGHRTTIIIIVGSVISTVILVSVIYFILRFRNRKYRIPSGVENFSQESPDEISNMEIIQFDFETIKEATNGFSNENKLGRGGFGAVYKGELLNGQSIAVKRLSRESNEGDAEFKNEVLVVAKLHHRNLVRLLGFCSEADERLLIFEFLPNASLDHFLNDLVKRTILNWETRYKIINGIARGLLYLHEDSRVRIIHRDLKASNILLDEKMNPKIADFGIARSFELDETRGQTKRIVGTFGYMAPEYAYHGQFSMKSDVFSFGVLILEIISSQRNSDVRGGGENTENLLSFAWKKLREGTPESVIDPVLGSGSRAEIIRCIHIGLLCVQENAENRPTIGSVVLMLNSISFNLPGPSRPGLFLHSNDMSSNDQNHYLEASQNVASISELYPR